MGTSSSQDGHLSIGLADLDMKAVLESIPDGVYITDTSRRIVYWNKAARDITGWDCDCVVGKRCSDNVLCHIDKNGHLLCGQEHCPLHRSMTTDRPSSEPHVIYAKRKDGSRIPVEVMVSPIHDGNGNVIGGVEVFRDLSPAYRDLNRARLIQQNAMGLSIPEDPRVSIHASYMPRELVGGDFYRVEALNDHEYAFMIADVMGHGIPAALYSMQLRTLWDDGRAHLRDPAYFLRWLNGRVQYLTDTHAGYFATAVNAIYDSVTGRLTVGAAGHPAPAVIGADGTITSLDASGPGLGLVGDPEYAEASVTIETGDSVLFFTDGTYEVTNAGGVEYGESNFFDLLKRIDMKRGSATLSEIEEALLRFSENLVLPDDLTMILLRRRL